MKTLKAFVLFLGLSMLTATQLNAQNMGGLFGRGDLFDFDWNFEDEEDTPRGMFNPSGNGIFNQTYGSDDDGFGITNQTYGQNEETPVGSGLLIMAVAGACYAGMKRNKKQTKSKTMRKYNFILMAFVLLLGTAQCKKEPATPNGDNNGGVRITLNVNNGPSTPSTGSGTESGANNGEKLNVYPATGAVIFTQGDKIYVGNNGKYVGTLTFDNGLFQGTINDDLCSTDDYLHFYFVGNKPTSPSALAAGTTSYTVNISDQSTGLPAISYAPSTAKYSPSTTSYTAKLLNKSALVKFVPSVSTSQPITVSGLNNEVQIDFANHTLAPTGNTGGITLFSAGESEKWAILLEQASLSGLTVSGSGFEATIDETTLPSAITNNMYYNAGVGISMTAVYVTYEANNSNWASVLASFNAVPTPNPVLVLTGDITINGEGSVISRANGTLDLNGHTLKWDNVNTHALFLRNNVFGENLTIRNGTIEAPVDGNIGWSNWYCGTVIFEDITFKREVFFDGHLCELTNVNFAAGSMFENYTGGSGNPGLVIINSGKFNCAFHTNGNYATKGLTTIYGGKFSTNPSSIAYATIPEGYSIRSNTDSDSGTYPYVVKALTEPYEITSSSSDPSVDSFNNAASTPTPTLHFNTDYEFGLKITRANGIVDFNGHSAKELFIQNDVEGESITFQNGTITPNPIDGSNQGFYYKGTVILENMTVNGLIYTDGHAYIINSGTYNNKICCDTYSDCPGTTTIYGGYFTELGFNTTTHGTYILYGGKYKTRPNDSWCATGYSIKSNTDNDAATYPWIVSADAPVVSYPEGAINGKFTINSNGDQVYFSQGNLQYIGSAAMPYWKFANNQWDVLGTTTGQNSSDQNVDRDLFGWGTSGWNNENTYYRPWDTDHINDNLYGPPGPYDLTGTYANADWGVYNPISNGGGQAGQWRTLTQEEWVWVLGPSSSPSPGVNCRTSSTVNGTPNARYAKGQVAGVHGLIVFPDSYTHPSGVAQPVGINETEMVNTGWNGNDYSSTDFGLMQANGAVFLPAAGYRDGTSVGDVGSNGLYWSASYYGSSNAYFVYFYDSNLNQLSHYRYLGFSVRLVRDVE